MQAIRNLMVFAAVLGFILPFSISQAAADGKAAFTAGKCAKCHSVDAAGIKAEKAKARGGDLPKQARDKAVEALALDAPPPDPWEAFDVTSERGNDDGEA